MRHALIQKSSPDIIFLKGYKAVDGMIGIAEHLTKNLDDVYIYMDYNSRPPRNRCRKISYI